MKRILLATLGGVGVVVVITLLALATYRTTESREADRRAAEQRQAEQLRIEQEAAQSQVQGLVEKNTANYEGCRNGLLAYNSLPSATRAKLPAVSCQE